jgi:transposase
MTNSEQRRLTNWRLKVLQAATRAGNVARTCRHFGLSRKTFYKWHRRYRERGDTGLADRARAPHHSPRATPPDVVSKILYLRQHYHFGPGKIADYLKRFHSLSIACASVHRILRKHGMNRLPANQKYRRHAHRWTRYEKAQPGHRLQVDVKFLERIPGTRRAVLSIYGDRRLHSDPGAEGLRRLQSTNGHRIHHRCPPAVAVPRPCHSDR